jgi:hypothetical protein
MSNDTIVLSTDDTTAMALVATIKSAVNGAGKYVAYVDAHNVVRETVKFHAAALAVLAYPNDKPVQKIDGKRTRFGNAVQAAGNGLRAALGKAESDGETIVNLLTRAGLKAELEDVILAWKVAQENNA